MKNLRKYGLFVAMIAGVLVGVVGCFSNNTPERTYFSVDYTLNTQPREASPKYDKTVVIQNVTSALAYDRQEIVYRANPYQFQYYWYRLWASKPRKMLRELITNHLRYTNLFRSVSSMIEDRLPDYLLDIDINAIEELDVSQKEWYAHLSLRFTLQNVEDNRIVWSYEFDSRRAVADNQPVYVVKAMSELLDAELVRTFKDLDETLSQKSLNRHEAPESASSVADAATPQDQPSATLINGRN